MDLGCIYSGWAVVVIWTHRNCPQGALGGQNNPQNAIKQAILAIGGSGGSKCLDLSGSWLDLAGIHPGWSVCAIWTHRNCPRRPPGRSEIWWVPMAPTEHPGCIPPRSTEIQSFGATANLWPEMPVLWHFRAISDNKNRALFKISNFR